MLYFHRMFFTSCRMMHTHTHTHTKTSWVFTARITQPLVLSQCTLEQNESHRGGNFTVFTLQRRFNDAQIRFDLNIFIQTEITGAGNTVSRGHALRRLPGFLSYSSFQNSSIVESTSFNITSKYLASDLLLIYISSSLTSLANNFF